jgi:archaemetzincin
LLRIVLFPVGEVNPAVLSLLKEDLPGILDAEAVLSPAIPLARRHLPENRSQYLADGLLGDFSSMVRAPGTVHLGITEADLFSPGLNFVFGIASRGRALISTLRLRPEFYGRLENLMVFSSATGPPDQAAESRTQAVFRRRVLVEAVHELGHALGLDHCEFPGCVMYFSNWIGDTDRKGPGFCFRCARTLERLMMTEET